MNFDQLKNSKLLQIPIIKKVKLQLAASSRIGGFGARSRILEADMQ
jgi:hypothetical protein